METRGDPFGAAGSIPSVTIVMMNVLGFDIGSSSIKAGIVKDGRIVGRLVRAGFPTRRSGVIAEVDADAVLVALAAATRQLGKAALKADLIGLSVMSPAWVAMDRSGKTLTPLVTHQDRRSVEIARELESRLGKSRWLDIAGNRPFPGGISATTLAWFLKHEPARMKRADLIGHLNTFLHRRLTDQRVIDPSNASFTGLFDTVGLSGWSDELCDVIGVSRSTLPDIFDADRLPGTITAEAARQFGLRQGMPVMAGIIDTSSAMFLAGAKPGQLLNITGSTDVLGLCVDRPRPGDRLLTRALGAGRLWMSVATLAAAGSALVWAKEQLFPDLSWKQFTKLKAKLTETSMSRTSTASQRSASLRISAALQKPAKSRRLSASSPTSTSQASPETSGDAAGVRFEPYLAGERASIDQKRAAFTGLTLSTTRDDMLAAIIDALAQASAARLPLLAETGSKMKRSVVTSGGAGAGPEHDLFHRDWRGRWTFRHEEEASLRGLGLLANHKPSHRRGGELSTGG